MSMFSTEEYDQNPLRKLGKEIICEECHTVFPSYNFNEIEYLAMSRMTTCRHRKLTFLSMFELKEENEKLFKIKSQAYQTVKSFFEDKESLDKNMYKLGKEIQYNG